MLGKFIGDVAMGNAQNDPEMEAHQVCQGLQFHHRTAYTLHHLKPNNTIYHNILLLTLLLASLDAPESVSNVAAADAVPPFLPPDHA